MAKMWRRGLKNMGLWGPFHLKSSPEDILYHFKMVWHVLLRPLRPELVGPNR
jgi:hypothetical protein